MSMEGIENKGMYVRPARSFQEGRLSFGEYQKRSGETAVYPERGKNPYYPALGLGECGEVQNQVKKIMRDDGGQITEERRRAVSKELGDVLWYVAQMCYELDLNMEFVALENLDKLAKRKQDGTITGSGDKR